MNFAGKLVKKIIAYIILLFITGSQSVPAQDEPLIVTSATMIADMAANVAGDFGKVRTIVPVGNDPHIYEPTPSDARLVAGADVIFVNGLTFEGWLNELIANSGTKAPVITVTEGIDAIKSLQYANATDPHAWMDPELVKIYVKNILNTLTRLYPEKKESFIENAEEYNKKLEELDEYISEQINRIPSQRRVLITSHDAFQYYGRKYGLKLESVLGTSTDGDIRTESLIHLNRVIKETGIPAVFIETTVNPKVLQQIAEDNNIRIGGKLFSDSLGEKSGPASTYLTMMRHNTDQIVKALMSEEVLVEENRETSVASYVGIILVCLFIAVLVVILLIKR